MDNKTWVSILALTVALVTFIWRLRDEHISYLRVTLSVVSQTNGLAIAKTTISNESVRLKRLGAVFLLIGPEGEDPIVTFNRLAAPAGADAACCAIDFDRLVPKTAIVDKDKLRQILPLKYFTEENDNVGDEVLSYSSSIDIGAVSPRERLSVRFYVYRHRSRRQDYHRKVQDLIVVPDLQETVGSQTASARHSNWDSAPEETTHAYLADAPCRSLCGCPRKLRSKKAQK